MNRFRISAVALAITTLAGCAQDVPTELPVNATASLAKISGADQGGRPFSIMLSGAAEVPGPGDPDGSGTALLTLNQGQGTICFKIDVSNITLPASGAHIHRGTATQSGPVVVGLTPPGRSGTSSGCVEVSPELIKDIRQNPAEYYVNVHTTDFRPGAVRGQLAK